MKKELSTPQKRALWIFANKRFPLRHIHLLTARSLRSKRLIDAKWERLTAKGRRAFERHVNTAKLKTIFQD